MKKYVLLILLALAGFIIIVTQWPQETFVDLTEVESFGENVLTFKLSYHSDGYLIDGFMIRPKSESSKEEYPVIIYNRGDDTANMTDMRLVRSVTEYANQGFVVFISKYRIGLKDDLDEYGGSDVNDVRDLLDIVKRLDYVDESRIHMLGASRGTLMTLIALRGRSDVKSAAISAGISDLTYFYNNTRNSIKIKLRGAIGGTPEQLPEEYVKRSAVNWYNEINVPLLIMHGEKDYVVDPKQSETLFKLLDEAGMTTKLVIYEGDDHNISNSYKEKVNEVISWFNSQP